MKELLCTLGALGLAVTISLVIYSTPSQRRQRTRLQQSDGGFTLIELLVVVVIICILVLIAIPLYLDYRHGHDMRTADARATHDLRVATQAYEQCYRANGGSYPTTPTTTRTQSFTLHCGALMRQVRLSKGTTLEVTALPKAIYLRTTNSQSPKAGKDSLYGRVTHTYVKLR